MEDRGGYLTITTGWVAGLLAGGTIGYLIAGKLQGDPDASFANLGLLLLVIATVLACAFLSGFIVVLAVLLLGRYHHILLTSGFLVLLLVAVLFLSSFLGIPIILIPFVPAASRHLALMTAKKLAHR